MNAHFIKELKVKSSPSVKPNREISIHMLFFKVVMFKQFIGNFLKSQSKGWDLKNVNVDSFLQSNLNQIWCSLKQTFL